MKRKSSCLATKRKKRVKPCKVQKITTCGGKYYYDAAAAERAVKFFENFLRHTKGRWVGQPFILANWQQKVIKSAFGWKRKKDGYRRFRKVYVEVPKKNGKSGMCAGLGLYLTAADKEPGAEVYSAAVNKDQARIVQGEAVEMVNASKKLRRFCRVVNKIIVVPRLRSFYKAVSKETASKHGINAHGVIFDELHALKFYELFDVMTSGSTAARSQPMTVIITTAGYDKNSVCWQEHDEAVKVIKNERRDEELLAVIYAADEKDDWKDPRVWRKANPSLGITLSEEDLAKECERAQRNPRLENYFKRLRLNIWTQQATRWLSMPLWDKCAGKLDLNKLKGCECYGGLDLSSTTDLSAFVLVFPTQEGIKALPHFFLPKDNIEEREKEDAVLYRRWANKELITLTDGNVIDYDAILGKMEEAKAFFDLRETGYDPYNATKFVQDCEKKSFKMVPMRQGFLSLSPPSKELERLVLSRKIRHGGHPVLRWMADNVEVVTDAADNIKPVKPEGAGKRTKRIDGIIGLVMALDRYMRSGSSGKSVYEERGVRTV